MDRLRENALRTQRALVPINEQGGRVRDYLERLVKLAPVRPTAVTSVVTTDVFQNSLGPLHPRSFRWRTLWGRRG